MMIAKFILKLTLYLTILSTLVGVQIRLQIERGFQTGDLYPIRYVIQQQVANEEPIVYGVRWQRDALKLYKLESIIAHDADIVTIGSSRLMFFQKQNFINGSEIFYNGYVEGVSSMELRQMVDYLAIHQALPEIIILGIDYPRFNLATTQSNPRETPDPLPSYIATEFEFLSNSVTDYVQNRYGTNISVSGVEDFHLIGRYARTSFDGFYNDGSRIFLSTTPLAATQSHLKRFQDREDMYAIGDTVDISALDNFAYMLSVFDTHDVEVIGVLPPYRAEIWETFVTSGEYEYIHTATDYLSDLFASYQYPLLNYSDVTQLTDEQEMWDGWHPSALLSTRMILDMASQPDSVLAPYVEIDYLESAIENARSPYRVFYDFRHSEVLFGN